jgi:hypothetical protein
MTGVRGCLTVGEEVATSRFGRSDFERFEERLRGETELLRCWFDEGRFADSGSIAGFELEVWLVDSGGNPAPINDRFLSELDDPLVVRELARFNVEINSTPHALTGNVLRSMHAELEGTWTRCRNCARALGGDMLMIGILPTATESMLTLANMSPLARYRALNEQILRLRGGRPLVLDIGGRDHLITSHRDVMLESAATSLQMHLQVSQAQAARFFNAAQVLSAPMVAVAANAAYLFGKNLWDDTRIPLFEQAIALRGVRDGSGAPVARVTFGSGYVRESLLECFVENLERYPVLLPMVFSGEATEFHHVRLHNGTIWRWNRPLIGVDAAGAHLRVEHRVASAGPSILDVVANMALFYGLVYALAEDRPAPENLLAFSQARANFYHAAEHGLDAAVTWVDGREVTVRELLLEQLLPSAREGLQALGVDASDIDFYLGVVRERVRLRRNGAAWQRAFVSKYGADMKALVAAYAAHQSSGLAVHEWSV